MAVINDPNTAANIARVGAVDTSAGGAPAHVSVRPDEYGTLGHYIMHAATGSIAAGLAANSELVQLRYTGTNKVIVHSIGIEYAVYTTAFAAGAFEFKVQRAINWTVDGSGGGTVTPLKLRTSMSAPTATVRVATTAALGAGTKTLDATILRGVRGAVVTGVSTAGGNPFLQNADATADVPLGFATPVALWPEQDADVLRRHPLVLAQNEGVVVLATVPGTGVWIAGFTLRFAEVTNY